MKCNGESQEIVHSSARVNGQHRGQTRSDTRPGALAVLLALAALALAACSGVAAAPQVASLASTKATDRGGSTSLQPTGNPTQLLDEWATCMRSNGDPNQADPTIDASKDIQITMDNVPKSLEDEVHGSTGPCSNYLLAAETALRGGQPAPTDNPAQDDKYAECMRAHGFPNWPNTVDGETNFHGTGIDPTSAAAQSADKLCTEQVGGTYNASGTEEPGVVVVRGCTTPPGMKCPASPPGGPGGGSVAGSNG